uniref:Purple acid phosphatase n=1 Tax=Arion vulgaris TaxID=1028688 RepID=A0A0B6ZTI3_9EUPU
MIKVLEVGVALTVISVLTVGAEVYPPILLVQPQQIHIAYGETPNQIVISWSQIAWTEKSIVLYGFNGQLTQSKLGNSTKFVDSGLQKRTQFFSKVILDDLIPGKLYTYVVGNEYELSDEHMFQAMPEGQDWSPHLAVYGDMGNVNSRSLIRLEKEAYAGIYDAILHVGDFAYDMNDLEGTVGDEFMRQIQPLASRLPYMTCPGNHEEAYNFSHYRSRFVMPGDEGKMYYSFNMGPVHFVSVSTELIFFWYYGSTQIFKQYEWLKKDLEEANKPENRALRPWVVVFGHRPMYCSSTGTADCTRNESITRVGIPVLHIYGFEDVLYDNGVDLAIWAHEHSYERLWPLYNRTVMNGSYEHPYTDPKAPVQIITGSAGCRENVSGFVKKPAEWSAFHSMDYGYTRLLVLNKTHMHLEQVSDVQEGKVIDEFTIIKTFHGSYDKTGKKRALELPINLIEVNQRIGQAAKQNLP